jgi:hypothetical protein
MAPAADKLLEALLQIWDRLPELFGQDWPAVAERLEVLLARLQTGNLPLSAAGLDEELKRALGQSPEALRLLEEAAPGHPPLRTGSPPGPIRTRGGVQGKVYLAQDAGAGRTVTTRSGGPADTPSSTVASLLTELMGRARQRTVLRHVDLSCPERVAAGTRRFSVVVRLLARPSELTAGTTGLALQVWRPLQVRLDAPDFDVLNGAVGQTEVLPDGDSPPVVFDLRPRRAGTFVLTFDFFQDRNPLGTVTTHVECVEDAAARQSAPAGPAALRIEGGAVGPDLVLMIATHGEQAALEFTLIRDGGVWGRTFRPVPLTSDTASYAAGLYRHLTGLTVRADAAGAAHDRPVPWPLQGPEVDRRVRALGQNLWQDFIPQELKELYAQERTGWRDRSLLILSDDPHLPWELVWPYGSGWKDDAPWCCTLRLTRWLRRDAQNNGNESPPARLSLGSLAALVPYGSGLASAQEERLFLRDLARSHKLNDVSPSDANLEAVMQLLEKGGYDWLHVASHGKFHPASPDGDSAVWLEDGRTLTPAEIIGPEIEDHIRNRRPAFLFNACEVGRQGRGVTRLAGWATRLLRAGAGMFIGPLWEVTDDGALVFVRSLYDKLLAGGTVAEAVRQARQEARREGDPTWLAYSVYAHPNARLARPGSTA